MKKKSILKEKHYLNDRCLCGHKWEDHFLNIRNNQIWCGHDDTVNWLLSCECRNFQLNNLYHIEILAEEKKLI